MELLIVRHGIACERNAKRWPDDGERPLAARGMMRARRAAAGLRRLAPRPARVLVSPLERTRHTAAILAQFAGWPRAIPCPLLQPGASPEALLALLARSADQCVAVVGHQPDLGRLLALCVPGSAGGDAFELRKMGAALVGFAGAPRAGHGALVWLLPPALLRAARRLPLRG
jgi:phosphohistidine phosphatase